MGYQVGSIAINIGCAIAGSPLCAAVGQTLWAAMAGFNAETSLKIGARAGISAAVNTFIGAEFTNPFSNAAAHAVWGCVEGEVGGGGCGSGARGSLAYSALKNAGFGGTRESLKTVGDWVVNTMVEAAAGGLAARAGGGSFSQGAQSAAMAYLFNQVATSLTRAENGKVMHSYTDTNSVCEVSHELCSRTRVEGALKELPGPMLRQSSLTAGDLVWVGPGWIRAYPIDGGVLNVTTLAHIFDGGGGERGWVVRKVVFDGATFAIHSQGSGTHPFAWLGVVNNATVANGVWRATDTRIRDLVMDPNWKPR